MKAQGTRYDRVMGVIDSYKKKRFGILKGAALFFVGFVFCEVWVALITSNDWRLWVIGWGAFALLGVLTWLLLRWRNRAVDAQLAEAQAARDKAEKERVLLRKEIDAMIDDRAHPVHFPND